MGNTIHYYLDILEFRRKSVLDGGNAPPWASHSAPRSTALLVEQKRVRRIAQRPRCQHQEVLRPSLSPRALWPVSRLGAHILGDVPCRHGRSLAIGSRSVCARREPPIAPPAGTRNRRTRKRALTGSPSTPRGGGTDLQNLCRGLSAVRSGGSASRRPHAGVPRLRSRNPRGHGRNRSSERTRR